MGEKIKVKNTGKIIVGKAASAMKGEQWYKRTCNSADVRKLITKMKLSKPTPVSYFKLNHGSHGGSKVEEKYYKTLSNGYMICVDAGNCCIKIVLGMSTIYSIESCSKSEYNKIFKEVMSVLST